MKLRRFNCVKLTKNEAQSLAISVGQTIVGLGLAKGSVTLLSNSLSVHVPTYLIGKSIQSITAGWLTKLAGQAFITYFQQNQDWGDGGIQKVVQRQYKLNSREAYLKNFINMAMRKVVQPLDTSKRTRQLPPNLKPLQEEGALSLIHI